MAERIYVYDQQKLEKVICNMGDSLKERAHDIAVLAINDRKTRNINLICHIGIGDIPSIKILIDQAVDPVIIPIEVVDDDADV